MKINVRFVVVAVVLACIAALGFSRGAWAGPLMQGTVPGCHDTLTGDTSLTTCNATVSAPGGVTVTDIGLPADMPSLAGEKGAGAGSLNNGPYVNVSGLSGAVEICFPDLWGNGNIFHWAIPHGPWQYWPTYYKHGVGWATMACTMTWEGGIYTIEY